MFAAVASAIGQQQIGICQSFYAQLPKTQVAEMKFPTFLIFAATAFATTSAVAQNPSDTKPSSVKSFTISAPDTVTQGVPFQVTYVLTANQWGRGSAHEGKSVALQRVHYNTEKASDRLYSVLTTRAEYVTSRIGRVELPAMTVPIGDKTATSATRMVYVRPNPTYGKEMTAAHNWLVRNGANADSLCLTLESDNRAVMAFSDVRTGCFCLMAHADDWDRLSHPVLAYGVESPMEPSDETVDRVLMSLYTQQIEAVRKSDVPARAAASSDQKVAPLLGNLRWGQAEPYNSMLPRVGDKNSLLGCVPLAMGMVMKRHSWPDKGVSEILVSGKNGQISSYKFMTFIPLWRDYRPSYGKDEVAAAQPLAKTLSVLSLCAVSCGLSISKGVCLSSIKHILVNNLKYSGSVAYGNFSDATAADVKALLRAELAGGRPCIVSRGNHAFVCDGVNGDYFHCNLGWEGYCNGYYLLNVGRADDNVAVFDDIVYGIEPQRDAVKKKLTLARPNTLRNLMPAETLQRVTSLILDGPIGSDDIKLLRQMAGATDLNQRVQYPWGSLQQLDMSKAHFVDDSKPYLTERATGIWQQTKTSGVGGVLVETVNYDFDNMDDATWARFQSEVGAKLEGVSFSRSADGTYLIHYNARANVIGSRMFAGCSSLREFYLPESTRRINDYAFMGCQSIETIVVPSKVTGFGKVPFMGCASLRDLSYPQGARTSGALFENCSPGLKTKVYK